MAHAAPQPPGVGQLPWPHGGPPTRKYADGAGGDQNVALVAQQQATAVANGCEPWLTIAMTPGSSRSTLRDLLDVTPPFLTGNGVPLLRL